MAWRVASAGGRVGALGGRGPLYGLPQKEDPARRHANGARVCRRQPCAGRGPPRAAGRGSLVEPGAISRAVTTLRPPVFRSLWVGRLQLLFLDSDALVAP